MTAMLGSGLIWGSLVLTGAALMTLGWMPDQSPTRHMALARLALWVATGAIPLMAAVLAAPNLADEVQALLVPAILGVAGWLATYLQQLDERDQDQLDLMQALRAEIVITLHSLQERDPAAFAKRLDVAVAAALDAGTPYQAFLPLPGPQVVFAAVSDRIERLPSEVVERCIRFYSLAADVRSFAEDMRSAEFQALDLARRRPAYQNYFEMLTTLYRFAAQAVYEINKAMRIADPGHGLPADAVAEQARNGAASVNRPAAAPSGRGSAQDVSVGRP
jgi:hypothetical protein